MMKNNNKSGYFSVHTVIFTTLIILFFVGGILYFYTMLYKETSERITRIGKLNAEISADQIDKYLSTGVDTLRLAGYALDNMILDERPQEEIRNYINSQSVAIRNITSGNSPGLYGYINGEYFTGTGWVPYEGYDPVVRPWYVDAGASIGRVAVVGPYLDKRTETSVITLAKTLCDVKSVIAMDFSMERLQTIAEDLTSQGDSNAEIILNREYCVLAHSDKEEIGKNYFKEQGTFGRALIDKLRTSDESFFSLKYGGTDYIVYMTTVANDWFCLSVIDASEPLSRLKKPLLFMIAAALSIIAVQIFILFRARKNTKITLELTENLSQAEIAISQKESQIGEISRLAFRDALTGVGSMTAFQRYCEDFSEKRKDKIIPTAVVMMDVNLLKYINDVYGHDAGDKYLRGCCKIICETFKHSPVFRIGGDEFVAVLQNSDFTNRAELLDQLNEAFEKAFGQKNHDAWEHYSVAAGLSECDPQEASLEPALRRADKAMYEVKHAFQMKHGSYRKDSIKI